MGLSRVAGASPIRPFTVERLTDNSWPTPVGEMRQEDLRTPQTTLTRWSRPTAGTTHSTSPIQARHR